MKDFSEKITTLTEIIIQSRIINNKYNYISPENNTDKNNNNIQLLLLDAVDSTATAMQSTPHHVERILNDVITDGDMRFNIVSFSQSIIEYLLTGNKSPLKDILIKNIINNNDIYFINEWYAE